ncbi:hypothetical protein MKX03_000058, partial [Papaver bracteatum]
NPHNRTFHPMNDSRQLVVTHHGGYVFHFLCKGKLHEDPSSLVIGDSSWRVLMERKVMPSGDCTFVVRNYHR